MQRVLQMVPQVGLLKHWRPESQQMQNVVAGLGAPRCPEGPQQSEERNLAAPPVSQVRRQRQAERAQKGPAGRHSSRGLLGLSGRSLWLLTWLLIGCSLCSSNRCPWARSVLPLVLDNLHFFEKIRLDNSSPPKENEKKCVFLIQLKSC